MLPPFAAYLRVYEPLIAFGRTRAAHWRSYAAAGAALSTREGPVRQRELLRAAVGTGGTRLPELADEAYLMELDGAVLVCPWNLQVRAAGAALAARAQVPNTVADAFVPPALAAAAEEILTHWRDPTRNPEEGPPRLHEFAATWNVPLRWFILVDLDERDLSVRPGQRYLRYRTAMARARRRVHRTLAVLRRSVGDTPLTSAVEDSARWLEEFHPRSAVELDYGGLVQVMSDEQLREDDSPAMAADGIAALARGDASTASQRYEQLIERWRAVQLLERCN